MSDTSDTRETQADVSLVLASYARCRERGGFVKAFYHRLWSRDPAIAARFSATDMDRQEEIMREAINALLMYAGGSVVAGMALERIGRIHARKRHDVPPALYALFAESLIETARVWDSRWEPALEQRWRAALNPGLEYMTTLY